ncbi:hypothetical protein Acr_00g0027730 [Actinidia rufa]|uniref:Uncharacterized protein n=1 Tax=Actinidia rufa TaxID=165716 RepID=A0A7J0DFX9_9ERIC|nr:hypothetical protein Acr_00g0027730 [Actinidia rufa]
MPPRQARGCARPLLRAHGAGRARGDHEEGDGENHQESVIEEGANTPRGNVECARGAPTVAFGGVEFMQGMFIAIEQVVRNTVQAMQVPVRTVDKRATTTMKAFLQLRLLTFWGESDPLGESDPFLVEDWLKQVTRALDTILVTEEDLRVLFSSYQYKGKLFNSGRP